MTAAAPPSRRAPDLAGPPLVAERVGLLVVDKPAGVTSHDIVDVVRRRLKVARAGHLGTLDPGATGLLLVAVGPATRAIPVWQGGDKTYEATLQFGLVTATQDVHGEVLERTDRIPTEADARAAALTLTGDIEQVPPMVSALKHQGERLYRLARRGVHVERAPRRISVRRWEWLGFDGATARFRVVCSGGTYVRALAHDLGQRLGCGAALEQLRRLRSEPFGLERSIGLPELRSLDAATVWAGAGLTLEQAVAHLPALTLTPEEAVTVGFGSRPLVPASRTQGLPLKAGPRSVVLLAPGSARVLALAEIVEAGDAREVRAHVVLPWALAAPESSTSR